ncbi:hypothetical protein HGQ17_13400 [Nesterenkonia sp. MY13]|uniref:FtsK domain-containing protein n=1 Tax=Nesterenkonia sedimenti TaxID=1463632 RepID=A0A7X8YF56_9MICC|nr:FtsK/SpoIIIE domain-containing protein [Nesterenkonia sedimenti]NLS10972.1 hypothetical protein [Nesterenkonia sedimenti]
MSFAVTLVHTPGSISPARWQQLRAAAPGGFDHELRVVLKSSTGSPTGEGSIHGAALESALRAFLDHPAELQLSTAGHLLSELPAGSRHLHPGMVVRIAEEDTPLQPLRPPQLSLCVDTGPDAGRLIPLRRRQYSIGRGSVDIQISDPRLSREEGTLQVDRSGVRLRRSDAAETITSESELLLGSGRCQLAVSSPQPGPTVNWPPPRVPIGGNPPEGKQRMMLAFALVPLVAGLVLVMVTRMWFFLVFSAASALVAIGVYIHGARQRRRYRRKVREAADRWAEHVRRALACPGLVTSRLRAGLPSPTPTADCTPVVRLGTGELSAELDFGPSASNTEAYLRDLKQDCAVGIELTGGEMTHLQAPLRETLRICRWILVQLALNPQRPQVVLIDDGALAPPFVFRDLPWFRVQGSEMSDPGSETAEASAVTGEPALTDEPGVLVAISTVPESLIRQALQEGWHVILGEAAAIWDEVPGWSVDAAAEVLRIGPEGAAGYASGFRFEGIVESTLAEQLRLALRQIRSGSTTAGLPTACTLPLPQKLFTASAQQGLVAQLGRGAHGEREQLDLVSDGPHILLAGTTGAGKSELLKTLLLSLAADYPPSELALMLIDFKGGASFHRIAKLRHALGLVTDLSQAQAERTLEGIRSELLRREELFLAAGAGDYLEFRQLRPEDELPRIVVVIDEFRIFAHELPDQLDELMRLATLGRSLGLHLVLSTQRPQGVVTADIRANIGSSISLRVRTEEESRDVIGSPEAALISRLTPGRAVIRRAGEPPVPFQSAQLTSADAVPVAVPETTAGLARPASENTADDDAAAVIFHAAVAAGLAREHTPLLPDLPKTLSAEERLAPVHAESAVLLARLDDPARQLQSDLMLDPQIPTSFALLGESGAGAAAALAAVANQLALSPTPTDLYLLDGDRSLAEWADHRRTGAWLTEEDIPETEYLLDALVEELAARRLSGQRAQTPCVLIVTGYAQWHAAAQMNPGALEHQLGTLAAEGPAVGISVLIAGGRELAVSKLQGRIPARIYLPFGASEEVSYLWPALRSVDTLPGRGVLISATAASPGLALQLVSAAPEPAESHRGPAGVEALPAPAIRVRALPSNISASEITDSAESEEAAGVVVGVEQFTWEPARLRLSPVNLILGAPRTGKSTALELLAQQIPGAELITPLTQTPASLPEVLLVDDAQGCSEAQHQVIQQAVTAGVPVVATAQPSAAVFSQLPWAHAARLEGSNFILSPTARAQADAFAAMIPVLERPIPGRAVQLRPEGPRLIQWALPDHSLPSD